jgi:hypothetical protein
MPGPAPSCAQYCPCVRLIVVRANAVRMGSTAEADDGLRTRDLKLGKLALYQLSYVRSTA